MAKSKKNNKGRSNSQTTSKSSSKPVTTAADVEKSATEAEFARNKNALMEQFNKEMGELNRRKADAEEHNRQAKELSARLDGEVKELKEQKKQLEEQKKQLEEEYNAIKDEYSEAVETIETAERQAREKTDEAKDEYDRIVSEANDEADEIRGEAKNEADKIRETAEKERMDALAAAADEARAKWKEQIKHLEKQIEDISRREKKLFDAKAQLDRDRQTLELDREALEDEKAYVGQIKERYNSASPAKVEKLEIELQDELTKYGLLLQKYKEQSARFNEIQILLDTVKTEIEDVAGGKRIAALSEIVSQMQYFREQYKRLSEIYGKYPDGAGISALEEKAQRTEKLEQEKETLCRERDRYREEAAAARNLGRELEVVRQEVDATNALNEHLLQELQSHKTALESRTGDTCPSLSNVDAETEASDYVNGVNARLQRASISALRDVVSHVKNYAGSREKALYYTDNDIRAFLAGMAVSRLIILQGMSGTGKSSLPQIFSEAISGFNELIPVESSWRDRNELLGYYNDFNKKFNAKKFTIELYRSSKKRCREIPTFIILDEMNLARIEYYFSDFLSILQKTDYNEWLVELVSSDMRTLPMELPDDIKSRMRKDDPNIFEIWQKLEQSRQGDLKSETSDEEKEKLTAYLAKLGQLTGAKDLIDGRKIKVTENVWFVGTANQDESTFEISDKVYDRAQVVALNKKGEPDGTYQKTVQKFISVSELLKLFDSAIGGFGMEGEVKDRLDEIDKILIEKFDTSFGNRIVTQAIDFAAVYTAAGGKLSDALDYQISTKILRKVISHDNAEDFLELLEATKGYTETQRLINKRIKDLR